MRNDFSFARSETFLPDSLRLISTEANINIDAMSDRRRTFHSPVDTPLPEDSSDVTNIRNFYPLFLIGERLCPDYIRIKCDASWSPTYKATVGWLFQDSSGSSFHTGSSKFWAKTPLQAEAMALKCAISDAFSRGYRHINANSDYLNLVLQVCNSAALDHAVKAILLSLQHLVLSFHCMSLSHCPRTFNRIAHSIARLAMD
ncbi:uncharacterized protein LOC141600968 [Silene latifolia]|uniref:uncharacterized protein LOC141600968 n=1 Tax=Silene latifolia TaxID=37657 RepID=UPI003D77505A